MKMLYVIGEPGVGKTTVIKYLTRRCAHEVLTVPYVAWTHYNDRVCQLGYNRKTFGGTDALGMAAQKHVLEWLSETNYRYVLAEGDRLANGRFFDACDNMGIELTVATLLVSDEDVLAQRREQRNARVGKEQNEQWLRGRSTKVVNLWTDYGAQEWTFDVTHQHPLRTARALARHPVGRQFARIRRDNERRAA